MPAAPLFHRGDVVYLRSSAEIGKLESFRIDSIKQIQDGRWLYQINIGKKPPNQGLIGDTFDARITEPAILYTDAELITICEALNIIVVRLQRQIISTQNKRANCLPLPPAAEGAPRWSIGDEVYFDGSARIGFIQSTIITRIFDVGYQPGTKQHRYAYHTRIKRNLTFREDELISFCEAIQKVEDALTRELAEMTAKRDELCP